MSPRYSQVMMVSECSSLTAVNYPSLEWRIFELTDCRLGVWVRHFSPPCSWGAKCQVVYLSRPEPTRRCASRDSTSQNASFVEWFSRLERAVFRGISGEIFALFQACVGNFDTIPPWKVVGTLSLDSSRVTFKYFAFVSFCDTFFCVCSVMCRPPWWFECCFCRSSWINCWLLLAVLSNYFGHLVTSTFFVCKFRGLPGSTPVS